MTPRTRGIIIEISAWAIMLAVITLVIILTR